MLVVLIGVGISKIDAKFSSIVILGELVTSL